MQFDYRKAVFRIGDELIIRGKFVEDFGDDVLVKVEDPHGSTTVSVARRNICGVERTDESGK